ncbi:hypothetical protein FS837_010295 [Tulasnella sp. UAMH 9824]|nr:hypothetical protein FS837_010295 [Tulasnella sp. UAMH 9824]
MDNIDKQPTASSSSAPPARAIYTHLTSSVPSLPTPEVDSSSSWFESVIRTSFGDEPNLDMDHTKQVKDLESEKAKLDKELQDLQRRLDAAQAKSTAIEEKRRSAGNILADANRAVSAGGSR